MNVVDSSGWLEYFANGPNAGSFAPPLKDSTKLVVPIICVYEVFKVALRESGENAALQVCAAMQKGTVVDLTVTLAIAAAKLSFQHQIPMADSMILAVARSCRATIWTQDAHFKDLPGVKYVAKK